MRFYFVNHFFNGHLQVLPFMEDAKILKSQLCIKYLEIFTRAKDMENGFAELSIGLLVGIRDVLAIDQVVQGQIGSFIISMR